MDRGHGVLCRPRRETLKFEFRVSSRVSSVSVESSLDFRVFDTDIVIFPTCLVPLDTRHTNIGSRSRPQQKTRSHIVDNR